MKTNFERGQLNAQDDLNTNFTEIEAFINTPKPSEIYLSEGEEGSNATEGYRYRLGPIFAKANSQSLSDLPFTISADSVERYSLEFFRGGEVSWGRKHRLCLLPFEKRHYNLRFCKYWYAFRPNFKLAQRCVWTKNNGG